MIGILNYGMGNIGSVENMLRYIGSKSTIVYESSQLHNIDKLILPGVGRFDKAMEKINDIPEMKETLDYIALKKQIPILGICLGMQLLTNFSEEGNVAGLGWIDGKTQKFPLIDQLKIPHMGWNTANKNMHLALTKDLSSTNRYYFVHSYFVKVSDEASRMMTTNYGIEFDSGIINRSGNVFGVQFHPEKSHKFGMQILKNFAQI